MLHYRLCIILFFLQFNTSCNNQIFNNCPKYNFVKASIQDIIKSPNQYDGKRIELEGYYYEDFEVTALSEKRIELDESSIWLDFMYNEELIKKLKGNKPTNKYVKIRGVFNVNNKGHLNMFSGGITKICYIEVIN